MVTRRKFSREFKLEAVKLVAERGVAVAQAAKDLDVHENVLRKRVRELRDEPQEAFPGNGKQRAQGAAIARRRKEVAKLKMDSSVETTPPQSRRWSTSGPSREQHEAALTLSRLHPPRPMRIKAAAPNET